MLSNVDLYLVLQAVDNVKSQISNAVYNIAYSYTIDGDMCDMEELRKYILRELHKKVYITTGILNQYNKEFNIITEEVKRLLEEK